MSAGRDEEARHLRQAAMWIETVGEADRRAEADS